MDEPFSLAIVLAYFIRGKECIIGIRSREECCSFSFENEIYRSGTIYLLEQSSKIDGNPVRKPMKLLERDDAFSR